MMKESFVKPAATIAILLLTTACATPLKPPPVPAEIPEETPIISAEAAHNLKKIAVIVSATSRAEYERQLSNMKFDFQTRSYPNGPSKYPAECLIPPMIFLCLAIDAAADSAINAAKNAARPEKEKEIFDRDRVLIDLLTREDFPSLVMDRLTTQAASREFRFTSSLLAPVTPPGTLPEVPAHSDQGEWNALLVIQVSNPYVHEWRAPRQSRFSLPITAVGLSYTATLFTTPRHSKLADMYRFVSQPMNQSADQPRSMRDALLETIDDMVQQIDKALIAPLAQSASHSMRTRIPDQPAENSNALTVVPPAKQ